MIYTILKSGSSYLHFFILVSLISLSRMHYKYLSFIFVFFLAYSPTICSSQSLVIPLASVLPKDSLLKNQLVTSLNGLLAGNESSASKNEYVLKGQLLETLALLDEMKGMNRDTKSSDQNFYKCYFDNAVKLTEEDFLIQLNYVGIKDGSPVLRASFRLLAKKEQNRFYFYSPLRQNTNLWKHKTINRTSYFFKGKLNLNDVKVYEQVTF